MAEAIRTLSIKLNFKDAVGTQAVIDKIKSSFKGLEQVIQGNTKPAIQKLRNEINTFASTGNQSISTIESQVTALRALRREADINSKEFKELTADISKYEKQLNKAQGRRPSQGGAALRATQTAGAVISGGIFGGPEGAIGGLLGAPFGVSGAFAGAAIGAQIGGLRQAAAGTAEYAARIQKLKIALQGASGGLDNYNSALSAAREVTDTLNVPQDAAISGITRLTAAVKGAKGPIQDAETTFKNVTAAIKATGGSTEDVKGAITAMVQVFSKGKVSAEELSGQLGERLPGAVTMFAKANKMTLPELQKNLKAGTVGLNELMNFIVELGNTYGQTAEKISSSNADAGARLSVAIADMQADIGAALIPIGAQFQEAFAEFVRNISPYLVKILPRIGNLALKLAENLDTLAVAAVAALSVFGAAKIAAIVVNIGTIGKALELLKAKIVGISLLNPFTALAAGAGLLAGQIYNAGQEQRRFNQIVRDGTIAQIEQEIKLKQLERDRKIQLKLDVIRTSGGEKNLDQLTRLTLQEPIDRLKGEIDQLEERRRTALIDMQQGADLPLSLLPRFTYDEVKPEEKPTNSGKGADPLKAVRERERLLSKIADIEQKILESNKRGREAAQASVQSLKDELALLQESDPIKRIQLEFEQKRAQAHRETVAAIEATDDPMQMQLANQKYFLELEILSVEEQRRLKEAAEETNNVFESIKQSVEQGLTNAIMGLIDGTKSLSESLSGVLRQIAQIFVQAGTSSFLGAIGFADGGVIAKNKIVPFAYGGIVNKPTIFPMAKGAGIMGEAGPEAIMPLRRGSNGRLGVEASGGVGNVVVNVDASGSRVQGDQPNAKALGSAIGAAVQAELVRQKRPGGLLS